MKIVHSPLAAALVAMLLSAHAAPAADAPARALELDDVLTSVERYYPLLTAATERRNAADGKALAKRGAFDLRLGAKGKLKPEGFYETYEGDFSFEQPTAIYGIEIFGGYRVGDGQFAVWDGGLETNEDGEARFGLRIPILRDRSIDKRRAERRTSALDAAAAEPDLMKRRLGFDRAASLTYWDWVSTGMKLDLATQLLEIAELRQGQLTRRAERGAVAKIDLVDNERLILERRVKKIDAERAFEQATLRLSLFLRGEDGAPRVAERNRLPRIFPAENRPGLEYTQTAVSAALQSQPALRELAFKIERAEVDLAFAQNRLLPGFDVEVGGSKDFGEAAKTPDDKGEGVLQIRVAIDLPVQQRTARGDIVTAQAKLNQLLAEFEFAKDKVSADVTNSLIALRAAFDQVDAARRSRELADRLRDAEERKLTLGQSNLLNVNIRELQAFDAAVTLIATQADYFKALANYQFAVGGEPPTL